MGKKGFNKKTDCTDHVFLSIFNRRVLSQDLAEEDELKSPSCSTGTKYLEDGLWLETAKSY